MPAEKDCLRTDRHLDFYSEDSTNVDKLRRILNSFVTYDPEFGEWSVYNCIQGWHSISSLWQLEGITSPCCMLFASNYLFALQFLWQKMLWNPSISLILRLSPPKKKKSDISYLKTSQASNVPIHSRALLAAILCWLATLWHHKWLLASGVSALGQPCVIMSTLPLLLSIHLKLVTVLDYFIVATQSSHLNCQSWLLRGRMATIYTRYCCAHDKCRCTMI